MLEGPQGGGRMAPAGYWIYKLLKGRGVFNPGKETPVSGTALVSQIMGR